MMEPIPIKKMLVVEDNFIASQVARMVFESKGWFVDCVATGKSALDKLSEHYDLILLDIGLPDMDGFEVCKRIRQSGAALEDEKIVVLTAHSSYDSEKIAKELEADNFFAKPLTIDKCELILREDNKW